MASELVAAGTFLGRADEVVLKSLTRQGDGLQHNPGSGTALACRMSELQDEVGEVQTSCIKMDLQEEDLNISAPDREGTPRLDTWPQWCREHFGEGLQTKNEG